MGKSRIGKDVCDMRIKELIREAVLEDIGRGDLFSIVSDKRIVEAKIIAKEEGILSGLIYVKELGFMEHMDIEFLKKTVIE